MDNLFNKNFFGFYANIKDLGKVPIFDKVLAGGIVHLRQAHPTCKTVLHLGKKYNQQENIIKFCPKCEIIYSDALKEDWNPDNFTILY